MLNLGSQGAEVAPYRDAGFVPNTLEVDDCQDSSLVLRSTIELGVYENSLHNYLVRWATDKPNELFLAKLDASGHLIGLTYLEVLARVRRVGQSLLDRGLNQERPVAILSGNSIEHALLMLGCLAVGVPVAPISPNYGLLPGGETRIAEIVRILRPGLVFAQNAKMLEHLRRIPGLDTAFWVSVMPSSGSIPFSDFMDCECGAAYEAAVAAVNSETIAKILFTSGSTGSPKGVINTQRMLCSSVAMSGLLVNPIESPVQVEWMPWHHTMGGNAQFNTVLKNGGTLVIDEGRPTPDAFQKTIFALKSVSPTSVQTVPVGFAMLVDALSEDAELRTSFFSRLRRVSYGGAALQDGLIQAFQEQAVKTTGQRIAVMSGYGTTETAPGICITSWPSETSGEIGLPLPGVEVKLLPLGERYEIRVRGPNVTPGYFGRPDLTAAAFDEDGFYRVGDAVNFVDQKDRQRGLKFAGRLSENFKLTTGTWVLAGNLRLELLAATSPALQDIVVAGENRDSIAILAWPSTQVPDAILEQPNSRANTADLARDRGLINFVRRSLERYNVGQGKSGYVSAFRICEEPPSLAEGEITDKAYINQSAVLRRRGALVASLYATPAPSSVVRLEAPDRT